MLLHPAKENVSALIALMKRYRHAEVLQQGETVGLDAAGAADAAEGAALGDCRSLARWYLAGMEGRIQDGLDEAIAAVSRLSDAGWRDELGFAYGSIGFALGLSADFETGLQWLEQSIQDAQRRGDLAQLAGSLSHKGAVLAFADELEPAFDCFTQALEVAGPEPSVPRTKALNNLAYTLLARAAQPGHTDDERDQLAGQALARAEMALAELTGVPAAARWRSWALSNQAAALALLGRKDEALLCFQAGLALGKSNPRVHLELLVGCAALLLETGAWVEAGKLLDEAAQDAGGCAPADATADRQIELQIELAVLNGRSDEALKLSSRRFEQSRDRYRSRLRTVRRHAELFANLERSRRANAQAFKRIRDLDERQTALQQQAHFWRSEAMRDPLTGVLNRRGLDQSAARLLVPERPVGLALIDIDHFKAVNDRHGHAVGDRVLAETASLLSSTTRSGHLLARLGGEEFCLLFEPLGGRYADLMGEWARSTIALHPWERVVPGLDVTVSVGIATGTGDDKLQDLLARADLALYAAKAAGRNCVR